MIVLENKPTACQAARALAGNDIGAAGVIGRWGFGILTDGDLTIAVFGGETGCHGDSVALSDVRRLDHR